MRISPKLNRVHRISAKPKRGRLEQDSEWASSSGDSEEVGRKLPETGAWGQNPCEMGSRTDDNWSCRHCGARRIRLWLSQASLGCESQTFRNLVQIRANLPEPEAVTVSEFRQQIARFGEFSLGRPPIEPLWTGLLRRRSLGSQPQAAAAGP